MVTAASDLLIAVFGGSLSMAGILLVFVGFIFTRAQLFDNNKLRAERYRRVAQIGLVPFALAIVDAALCVRAIQCPTTQAFGVYALGLFWLELLVIMVYGVVGALFYL